MVESTKKHARLNDPKHTGPAVAMWQKRINELEAFSEDALNTKLQKSMLGDQSREAHNHEQRLRKTVADIAATTARKEELILKEKAKLEEEEERYKKEVKMLKEGFLKAIQNAEDELKQLEEKKVQQEKEHKEAKAEIEARMAERTPDGVAANIKAATLNELSEKAGMAVVETKTSEEQLKAKLLAAPKLQCISDEQAAGMAETAAAIVDEQIKALMANLAKQMLPMLPPDTEEEEVVAAEDDGFTQSAAGKAAAKNRARATRRLLTATAMVDDTDTRREATKRSGTDEPAGDSHPQASKLQNTSVDLEAVAASTDGAC